MVLTFKRDMKKEMQKRFIDFAAEVLLASGSMNKSFEAWHLKRQIVRSSTSCALNYGEAQHAESSRDFIHKLSIVLKELRETQVNIQLLNKVGLCIEGNNLEYLLSECDQLIAIMFSTIKTAKRNNQ